MSLPYRCDLPPRNRCVGIYALDVAWWRAGGPLWLSLGAKPGFSAIRSVRKLSGIPVSAGISVHPSSRTSEGHPSGSRRAGSAFLELELELARTGHKRNAWAGPGIRNPSAGMRFFTPGILQRSILQRSILQRLERTTIREDRRAGDRRFGFRLEGDVVSPGGFLGRRFGGGSRCSRGLILIALAASGAVQELDRLRIDLGRTALVARFVFPFSSLQSSLDVYGTPFCEVLAA